MSLVSALEEIKEDELLGDGSITPIDEEDEDDLKNMNKTTTFSNMNGFDIDDAGKNKVIKFLEINLYIGSISDTNSVTSKFDYDKR